MFELNDVEYTLEQIQKAATESNMDVNAYIDRATKESGLIDKRKDVPGKITPPKEDSQGVPVEGNATPEIPDTELPSEDISSDLQKIKSSFEQGEFTMAQRPAFEEFQKTGEIKQELLPIEKIKEKDPSIIESLAAKTVYGITIGRYFIGFTRSQKR